MAAVDAARGASADLQIRTLLHDLQVHSEEITVQNEQLIKAQHELEHARDRYADLYDFAPIGYLSVNASGIIIEINLAGCAVLGQPRQHLIGLPLGPLIVKEGRDRLAEFLLRAHTSTDRAPVHVEVRTRRTDRIIRLIARPLKTSDRDHELFTAMLDVTDERRFEEERIKAHDREQKKAAQLQNEIGVRIQAEDRVKALLDRLVQVQERERQRLALNLHDQLGQQLTALRLTIDSLKHARPGSDEARQRFEVVERIVTQLDRDVDFLAWELRPAALDDVGLEAALAEFLRQWSQLHGITADFHTALGETRLPPDMESHLYRIVQEALNNVSKHAEASSVSVMLEQRGDEVRLIIEDDGRGFDADALRHSPKHTAMGLAGMQERAVSIGGNLDFESAPEKGTTLFVRIPNRVSVPPAK